MDTNGLEFPITGRSLLKYAFPTLLANIFMNIYWMVDSFFVSNYIGTDALSALNIVVPVMLITSAFSAMIAAGGSALCAKYLGEGKREQARQVFTFLVLFALIICAAVCAAAFYFRRPLLYLMGANDELYQLCLNYAIVLLIVMPFATPGMLYQSFFVTAGYPGLGFGLAIGGGVLNMVLDYVLIALCSMGMTGAALASGIGYIFQSVAGTIYFLFKRKGLLYFIKPRCSAWDLKKSLTNGMSEMISLLTSSVTLIFMNVLLMRLSGSEGVAAVAIVMTVQTMLSAAYMGYLYGVAPVTSYNYGKGDTQNLKKIYRALQKTVGILSLTTTLLAVILARPIALIYGDGVETVISQAVRGMYLFIPAFLVMGFNMMASSMFTALNDGKTSAVISFCRTFVFLMLPLMILPWFMGAMGVWVSLPLAEMLTVVLAAYALRRGKRIYHYA